MSDRHSVANVFYIESDDEHKAVCSCGESRRANGQDGAEEDLTVGHIDPSNRADDWAAGRLTHTEECQIHKTPPAGWPFGGFSCNCEGVER